MECITSNKDFLKMFKVMGVCVGGHVWQIWQHISTYSQLVDCIKVLLAPAACVIVHINHSSSWFIVFKCWCQFIGRETWVGTLNDLPDVLGLRIDGEISTWNLGLHLIVHCLTLCHCSCSNRHNHRLQDLLKYPPPSFGK